MKAIKILVVILIVVLVIFLINKYVKKNSDNAKAITQEVQNVESLVDDNTEANEAKDNNESQIND